MNEQTLKAPLRILNGIRKFLASDWYYLSVTVLCAIFYTLKQEVIGALVLGYIAGIVFVLSDDLSPVTLPFLLIASSVLRLYDSADLWFSYIPAIIPIIPLIAVHFILYRPRYRIGKMFFPLLAVAVAVTLGGIGITSVKDYFSPTNLYYVVMLGFGMVILYVIFYNHIGIKKDFDYKKYLTKVMLYFGAFLVYMLFVVYVESFIEDKELYIQMGNNLSANLLMTMPFAFYYSTVSRRYSMAFFCLGLLENLALVLSLSRGGMLFGTVMVVPCALFAVKKSAKQDKPFLITALVLSGLVAIIALFAYIDEIIPMLAVKKDEARIYLYTGAVKAFFEYPLLGVGFLFNTADKIPTGAIYWYHSTPFQIIGSMGLVGILAYCYYYVYRCVILWKNRKSKFNVCIALSFIGFELLALVNPGTFCPLPYVAMMTCIFTVFEKMNGSEPLPYIKDLFPSKIKKTKTV